VRWAHNLPHLCAYCLKFFPNEGLNFCASEKKDKSIPLQAFDRPWGSVKGKEPGSVTVTKGCPNNGLQVAYSYKDTLIQRNKFIETYRASYIISLGHKINLLKFRNKYIPVFVE
jgi:hypothetical protein